MKKAEDRSVLLIAPHPFFTERGTPIAVRDMAAILTHGGWKVTILTMPFGEEPPGLEGVEVIRVGKIPFLRRVGIGLTVGKLIADVFLWFKLVRVLLRRRFAAYHAVEESVFLAYAASLVFPARIVYDMDSSMGDQIVEKIPSLSIFHGTFRLAEKFVMRRVDWIFPVCPVLHEICRELAPQTPATTIHDVPPLPTKIDPQSLLALRELFEEGTKIALYVGNFEPYQGVDLLISAMESMPPEVPVRVVLAGGGRRMDSLRRRVEEGRAKGRVLFAGPQPLEHLPYLLPQADILLSPRCKGVNTPMKIYGYLAAGRAILATRILSHTQVIHENAAFWVEATEDDIARGLETLAASESKRRSLGTAAVALWEQSFSRERLGGKVLSAYEKVFSGDAVAGDAPESPPSG